MKKLTVTLSLVLFFGFSANAQAKKLDYLLDEALDNGVVKAMGSLKVENLFGQFTTLEGEHIALQNTHLYWQDCSLGEFVLEFNEAGIYTEYAGWRLVDMISCHDTDFAMVEEDDEVYCPTIYEPICAQPPMPKCPEGRLCIQMMPTPQTYSNSCFMSKDNAAPLYMGSCRDGFVDLATH